MPYKDIKTVLLGATAAGKSSLAVRMVKDEFNPHGDTTIGVSFLPLNVVYGEETRKLNLWDTAGQERYASMSAMYTRGAGIILLTLSQNDRDAFKGSQTYLRCLEGLEKKSVSIFIIATHRDLADLSAGAADRLAEIASKQGWTVRGTFHISSSTGDGITELKTALAKCAVENHSIVEKDEPEVASVMRRKTQESSCCSASPV